MTRGGPPSDAPTRVFLGLATLLMATVLGYFSAAPTLRCVRGARGTADCEVRAVVLGLATVHEARVAGVRAAELFGERALRSRTPPRLTFVTAEGRQDLGYFSQQFTHEWDRIDAFARQPTDAGLHVVPRPSLRRFGGPLVFVLMVLTGFSMLVSALRRR